MGCGNSQQSAPTTNQSTTNVLGPGSNQAGGSIIYNGLTGATATQLAKILTRSFDNTVDASTQLSELAFAQTNASFNAFQTNAFQSLADVTNATRDFSQRAIAGSTGQATPLQQLAGASAGSGSGSDTNMNGAIVLVGVLGLAIAIFNK
jgi:hypothetical protein